jgi:C_GCAxxG_C_C family probable redox protein
LGGILNTKTEIALELFGKGFNCAQAVLESHSAEFGLDTAVSRKIAGAFGGGMGHCGETCGAVSGALMLIGLKYGQYKDGDSDSKAKTYKVTKEYVRRFKEEFGSVRCTELLKYDLTIEEELLKAREAGVLKTVCPELIKKSVELVEEIL